MVNAEYKEYTDGIFSIVVSFTKHLEAYHPPQEAKAIVARYLDSLIRGLTNDATPQEKENE